MRRVPPLVAAILVAFFPVVAPAVASLRPPSAAAWPQDPKPSAAALQRMHQLAQPGEPHALLQRLVGDWDVVVHTSLDGTGQEGRGRMQGKALLGGRYVQLDFAFKLQGADVAAVQVLGHDALLGRFTSSWRDSLSTWATECAGAPSAAWRDGLALAGTLIEPADGATRPFRLELELGDFERVTSRLLVGEGAAARQVQTQTWTRR